MVMVLLIRTNTKPVPIRSIKYSFGGSQTDKSIDSDGDGLSNAQEQDIYKTDPGKADTDNDGVSDGKEVEKSTNPLHPMSVFSDDPNLRNLAQPRSLNLVDMSSGGVELPEPDRFGFVTTNGWTIELWFNMGTDTNGTFFAFEGRDGDSIDFSLYNGTPCGRIISSDGTEKAVVGGPLFQGEGVLPLPKNRWIHLALVWAPQSFQIYRNGELLVAQQTDYQPAEGSGRAFLARGFADGYLDEVRIWNRVREADEIADWFERIYPAPGYVSAGKVGTIPTRMVSGIYRYNAYLYSIGDYDERLAQAWKPSYRYGQPLVAYYRFDDAGAFIEDFAALNDAAYYLDVPVTALVAYEAQGTDDADGDGLPEWWLDTNDLDYYYDYQLGPYHFLDDTTVSDYPVSFAQGWGTEAGTAGINTRMYYVTDVSTLGTGGVSLIRYNVWKDIDPVETTNDTLREDYEGKGIYNEAYDERVWLDGGVWFVPDGTAGMNTDILFNDSDGSKLYSGGEDIWINVPGGDGGAYDLQQVMGISYYRTFTAYGSIGASLNKGWTEDDDTAVYPKDSSVGYDGMNSTFFRYVYLDSKPESASLNLVVQGVTSNEVYINGSAYDYTSDPDEVKLVSLLKQGRNALYVKTKNYGSDTLEEIDIHYTADFNRALTWMKFDLSLTVNGDEVVKRGDDTVADPRSVWHGNAWSDFYAENHGSLPYKDTSTPVSKGQLNPDYGIPLDPDGDGLDDYYEFKIVTNPDGKDSDNDGLLDGLEDFDGDGLVNIDELTANSDPTLPDTDDDGLGDAYEKEQMFFSPVDSRSPFIQRGLFFSNGSMNDYMECPVQKRFSLSDFAVEAWVAPMSSMPGQGGYVLRRAKAGGGDGNGLALGLDAWLRPYVSFSSGSSTVLVQSVTAIPANGMVNAMTNWTHLACTYNSANRNLKLLVNGTEVARKVDADVPTFGYLSYPVQRFGEQFLGAIDEVRIWNTPQFPSWQTAPDGTETNLVAYYRFDDSTGQTPTGPNNQWEITRTSYGQVEDFVQRAAYQYDWNNRWIHAGSLNGYVQFWTNKYLDILQLEGDTDTDGIPDVWETEYASIMSPLIFDSQLDGDSDGWDNLSEFLNGTDPSDPNGYPKPKLDIQVSCDEMDIEGNVMVLIYDTPDMSGDPVAEAIVGVNVYSVGWQPLFTTTADDYFRTQFSGTLPLTGGRTIQAGSVRFDNYNSVMWGRIDYTFELSDGGDGNLSSSVGTYAGTIDYLTGQYTLTAPSNSVPPGVLVYAAWNEEIQPTYPRTMPIESFASGKLRQGNNWLFIFVDANNNGTYDKGEYASLSNPEPINIKYGDVYDVKVGLETEKNLYGRFSWDEQSGGSYYVTVYGGPAVYTNWMSRTYVHEGDYMAQGQYGLPKPGTYSWSVTTERNGASIASGSFVVSYPYSLSNFSPVPVRPTGSFIAPGRPEFVFNISTNFTKFDLRVYNQYGALIKNYAGETLYYVDRNGQSTFVPDDLYYGYDVMPAGTYTWWVRGWNPYNGYSGWSATRSFTFSVSEAQTGPYAVAGDIYYQDKIDNVPYVVAAYKSAGFSGTPEQMVRVNKVTATNDPMEASKTPYTLLPLAKGPYYIMAFMDSNRNGQWDSFESYGFVSDPLDEYKPGRVDVYASKMGINIKVRDVDTDGDMIPDAWEYAQFGSLEVAKRGNVRGWTDSDGDGLNDLEEYNRMAAASNPNAKDSDNDGLNDGDEVMVYGLDPSNADNDNDGLTDGQEVNTYKSNPNDPDSDNDMVPDGMEVQFNSRMNSSDSDGDGYCDVLEIVGGFDPNASENHPNSEALFEIWQAQLGGGRMAVSYKVDDAAFPSDRTLSLSKKVRVVLQSRNGADGDWQDVPAGSRLLSTRSDGDVEDSDVQNSDARFYRLRWELEK